MRKLTDAQHRMLVEVPADWASIPLRGDFRPLRPLLRAALVERRTCDVTPKDWGMSVRCVTDEWRITDAGRAALANHDA